VGAGKGLAFLTSSKSFIDITANLNLMRAHTNTNFLKMALDVMNALATHK